MAKLSWQKNPPQFRRVKLKNLKVNKMKTIILDVGSAAWLQSRSASKAAAVMGLDAHTSRSDMLRMMATGIGKEFSDWQQKHLLDMGHVSEVGALKYAEEILGDDLSPVCGATDDGYLTASFDGLTFGGTEAAECKAWNESLAALVRNGEVPDSHWPQLEQQILVGGLDYVLFVVGDGSEGNTVCMKYHAVPGRAEKLLAAWKQFDIDLSEYQHVEHAPSATAAPIMDLPAIIITATGELSVETNFARWGSELNAFIQRIPANPETDQEFVDCKAAVAALKKAEVQLDAEESRVLSMVPSIDDMKREKKLLANLSRTTRLALEKLVVQRETAVKVEIMQAGKDALASHIAGLNKRLATVQMPPISADFAQAIKSKRNLSSMRGAVADLVAEKKIESNELADKIGLNLNTVNQIADYYKSLFSDFSTLVMKAPDDLALVITSRIAAEDARRAAENERILNAAREKIREEEEKKANEKAEAERKRVSAIQQRITDIRAYPMRTHGMNSYQVTEMLRILHLVEINDSFAEFSGEAKAAKDDAITHMAVVRDNRAAEEAEAKHQADERNRIAAFEKLKIDSAGRVVEEITAAAPEHVETAPLVVVEPGAPVDLQSVVIDNQDSVRAFLDSREWRDDQARNVARAIVLEWEKFKAARQAV
jgi:predicted phage-related endonuclease